MTAANLFGFTAASMAIALSPGPSWFYVMAATLADGKRGGTWAIAGNAAGILAHVVAVATGIAALLTIYPVAFAALKWGGVAFLFWLGIKTLRQGTSGAAVEAANPRSSLQIFRDGVVMAILNPKIAILMLALLPQFIVLERAALPQIGALGSVHILVASVTLFFVATFTHAIEERLRESPAWAARLRWFTGGALIFFAILLATMRGL